jgi:hypothetical protein
MNATTVFVKTDKGREEIESRTYRLPFTQRTVLIMVDGIKNADALSAVRPDAQATLDTLLEAGFIAVAGAAVGSSVETVASSAPPVVASTAAAIPSTTFNLGESRKRAAKFVTASLGPMGDSLAMAIEDAKTIGDFVKHAEKAREAIRMQRGAERASEFWALIGL